MSGNVFFGWPNLIDDATLSGGSWEGDTPLSNLQSGDLSLWAHSTDDANASTKFDMDFGAAVATRVVAVPRSNLSQTSRIKVTWGTTSGGSDVADSGWLNAWAMTIGAGGILWPPSGSLGARYLTFVPTPTLAAVSARYIRVEFDDTSNANGRVSIARPWVGDGLVPAIGIALGMTDGMQDFATVNVALSGAIAANERHRLRKVALVLDHLTEAEATRIWAQQFDGGLAGEALYLLDLSDRATSQQYGFVGRMLDLTPLRYPRYRTRSIEIQMLERS